MVPAFFLFALAQVSKSLLNAGPTSAIMSVVVVERPCFWKAWWLHCLVREHAPKAATRRGLKLEGRGISKALCEAEVLGLQGCVRPQGPEATKGPDFPSWQFLVSYAAEAEGSFITVKITIYIP